MLLKVDKNDAIIMLSFLCRQHRILSKTGFLTYISIFPYMQNIAEPYLGLPQTSKMESITAKHCVSCCLKAVRLRCLRSYR